VGPLEVVERIDTSVLLAETVHKRSLVERLFGARDEGFQQPVPPESSSSRL
jgi:hypothetical protein